jgi:hypothetical protein
MQYHFQDSSVVAYLFFVNSCLIFVPLYQLAAPILQNNLFGEQVVHEGAEHTIIYIHICFMKVYGLKNMVFRYHTCLMQVM